MAKNRGKRRQLATRKEELQIPTTGESQKARVISPGCHEAKSRGPYILSSELGPLLLATGSLALRALTPCYKILEQAKLRIVNTRGTFLCLFMIFIWVELLAWSLTM